LEKEKKGKKGKKKEKRKLKEKEWTEFLHGSSQRHSVAPLLDAES